jgi:hypothetical protein
MAITALVALNDLSLLHEEECTENFIHGLNVSQNKDPKS